MSRIASLLGLLEVASEGEIPTSAKKYFTQVERGGLLLKIYAKNRSAQEFLLDGVAPLLGSVLNHSGLLKALDLEGFQRPIVIGGGLSEKVTELASLVATAKEDIAWIKVLPLLEDLKFAYEELHKAVDSWEVVHALEGIVSVIGSMIHVGLGYSKNDEVRSLASEIYKQTLKTAKALIALFYSSGKFDVDI